MKNSKMVGGKQALKIWNVNFGNIPLYSGRPQSFVYHSLENSLKLILQCE